MELQCGLLGNAIKRARCDKNLTQEKLAEMINITPMHVQQLESERRKPSFEVLYKLVFTLDISLDSLFLGTDDHKQELIQKINLNLSRCSSYELQVVYATVEALRNNVT